jgi:hypothetical protein
MAPRSSTPDPGARDGAPRNPVEAFRRLILTLLDRIEVLEALIGKPETLRTAERRRHIATLVQIPMTERRR